MTSDLIARLEAADCGSRELSDEVLRAFGWRRCIDKRLPNYGWLRPGADKPVRVGDDPDPTRNLQDAVSLVPEGWDGCIFLSGASRKKSAFMSLLRSAGARPGVSSST